MNKLRRQEKSTEKIGKITAKSEQSIIKALPRDDAKFESVVEPLQEVGDQHMVQSNVDQEKFGEFHHDQEGAVDNTLLKKSQVALEKTKDINEAGGMQKQATISGTNDLAQELDQQVHEEEEDNSDTPNIIKRAILDPLNPLEIIEVDTLPHAFFSSVLKSRQKNLRLLRLQQRMIQNYFVTDPLKIFLEGNKQLVFYPERSTC